MASLLFFALILVAFYFMIIRPQRARARQAAQLQANLAPGVEVMTTAGLFGTVTELRDDSVVLEVSPGVLVRFAKAAVGRIVDSSAADDADDTDDSTDADDSDGSSDTDGPSDTDVSSDTDGSSDADGPDDDDATHNEHDAQAGSRRASAGE